MWEIEELYRAHRQAVYSYLLSLSRDPVLAEDLLSETFLQALRSIGSFKGESSVRTWLCGIARHLWLRQLKGKRELLEYDDRLISFAGEDLDDRIAAGQAVGRIKALLLEKDERARTVVQMRLELFSYSEIAERLGISENSARVIEFRTRKWLKE
ncbi:MAG: sigma-70 family RNA polymerase sigma factor, partial [Oscillospiraceae bacterium]|nr:sigma-70 family RNA polymerase sigma factor [Oscillospiraceae bacterium]